jgi:hypothetical protein
MSFSNSDKAKEAEREIRMREHVYASKVWRGQMNQTTADRRLAIMREIADDYRKAAEQERLI